MSCFPVSQLLFSKSLTHLSPVPGLSPFPLLPIRSAFSPPLLLSFSTLPSLLRCRCSSAPSPSPHEEKFQDLLEVEDEEEEEEESDEDYALDVDALESEAKDAVRRYSSSLSRHLTIGNSLSLRLVSSYLK